MIKQQRTKITCIDRDVIFSFETRYDLTKENKNKNFTVK